MEQVKPYELTEEDQEFLRVTSDPNVDWTVSAVEALTDYRLHVQFCDGLVGVVYMRERILGDNAGVFSILRVPEMFAAVCCSNGYVEWPNNLDLAPDNMYFQFKKNGEWFLS